MAISASATATGLLRISILLAYCITVISLFFITRHFQGQKAAAVQGGKETRGLNISHVATGRGIGKWAKIRKGAFIGGGASKHGDSGLKGSEVKDSKKGGGDLKGAAEKGGKYEGSVGKKLDKNTKTEAKPKASGEVVGKKDQRDKTNSGRNRDAGDDDDDVDDEEDVKDHRQSDKDAQQKQRPSITTTMKPKPAPTNVKKITATNKEETGKSVSKDSSSSKVAQKASAPSPAPYISPERKKRLPDCLIIGARKAGTRPLLRFLRMHPQIKGVGHEVSFFNDPINYAKGLDWYIDQMPPVRPEKVLIEKSAEYFHSREAPQRVYIAKPNMKLILMVREPFERLVSDYYFIQRFAAMINSSYPFEELTHTLEDLCLNRTSGKVTTYSGLVRSRYVKHTESWLRWFRRDQLHIVDGDKFSEENPASELRLVEEFLRIEPFFEDEFFFLNTTKGYYCSHTAGCLDEEKGHDHPTFSPSFVHTIRTHLKPYNERFYDLVGMNFMWPTSYT